MLGIPRRYGHFVFGVLQSGLTCAVAAAIASFSSIPAGNFFRNWITSWFAAWVAVLPIVIFAAPLIRKLTDALTRDDGARRK
jgi:FtsH-binding integral membrane protein